MADNVDPLALDLAYLGQFVGQRVNELVLAKLAEEGYGDLRISHGYIVQHLITTPRTITDLAKRLGVSQQAASKSIAEMIELGYLESIPTTDDKRARAISLSKRGRDAIELTRKIRDKIENKIRAKHGKAVRTAELLLARVLVELGGAPAVRARQVKEPR